MIASDFFNTIYPLCDNLNGGAQIGCRIKLNPPPPYRSSDSAQCFPSDELSASVRTGCTPSAILPKKLFTRLV